MQNTARQSEANVTLRFIPITSDEHIEQLSNMASEIWHEYWPAIIGEEQTAYMVEMFHAPAVLRHEIDHDNYRFWFLQDEQGKLVGYTGAAVEEFSGTNEHDRAITRSTTVNERWPRRLFISKIYLYARERGKHYASRVIEFYEDLCRAEGLPAMYLTVNRGNELALRAYQGRGFSIVDEMDNDIGNGYVMNDFAMAKEIELAR